MSQTAPGLQSDTKAEFLETSAALTDCRALLGQKGPRQQQSSKNLKFYITLTRFIDELVRREASPVIE